MWISRRHDRPGWGATPEPSGEWSYDLEFTSMADFADAADQAFAASPGTPVMNAGGRDLVVTGQDRHRCLRQRQR